MTPLQMIDDKLMILRKRKKESKKGKLAPKIQRPCMPIIWSRSMSLSHLCIALLALLLYLNNRTHKLLPCIFVVAALNCHKFVENIHFNKVYLFARMLVAVFQNKVLKMMHFDDVLCYKFQWIKYISVGIHTNLRYFSNLYSPFMANTIHT